jgi:hypothetical protein
MLLHVRCSCPPRSGGLDPLARRRIARSYAATIATRTAPMNSLSVIVTACNVGPFIGRSLQSVHDALSLFNAEFGREARTEVIVVDDGSTDAHASRLAPLSGPGHALTWKRCRPRSQSGSRPQRLSAAGKRLETADCIVMRGSKEPNRASVRTVCDPPCSAGLTLQPGQPVLDGGGGHIFRVPDVPGRPVTSSACCRLIWARPAPFSHRPS